MTDASEPQAENARLFSGRLETLGQNFGVAFVFMLVTLGITSATIFGIGPTLANWPMNPAFDLAILFVCWLSGLPIVAGLVIAYFGKAERADTLKMPHVLRAARRVNTGRSMALIYAFALILALGGYIWIRIEFEGRSVPAMHLIAIAAGVWTGYYMLETLRARGWRWRR
ncbi:MAG: hypothetical protein GC208_08745 [Alphaproteobacteria bacterium]|nr:hypothetical protein [Alphaproteobacteria bacterium]